MLKCGPSVIALCARKAVGTTSKKAQAKRPASDFPNLKPMKRLPAAELPFAKNMSAEAIQAVQAGKWDILLEHIAAGSSVRAACEAAGISQVTVYGRRRSDPVFAAAWDAARDISFQVLEDEAKRRAVEGVVRPVFYKGAVCGEIEEFSDSLLSFMLEARIEAYRRKQQITGGLTVILDKGDEGV